MARVLFKQGEQQALSGTFCGMEYRTRNGKTYVHAQRLPELPKRPTAAQRAAYRRKIVLMLAVSEIQARIYRRAATSVARMQAVADMYHMIYQHCDERYDVWRPKFRSDEKMAQAMAFWFMTERYPLMLF